MFYCDYLNRQCDGMTQYEKLCSRCPSYRYNVIISNKYNDDDAFDKARDNDEPRHGKRKYDPFVRHEPDPNNVTFKERIKILTMIEYLSACDEYMKAGGKLSQHKEWFAFILQKADEKEKIMAKKKENQTTAMVDLQGLNESQIAIVTQRTPRHLIKQRKGRGGKTFDYLPHAEVAKILNGAFNHAWDWKVEPILEMCNENEVTVRGKLTIHGPNGQKIVKEQFGSMDIPHNSQGKPTMSFGDALKGASSDSLKKAASLLGIALDLYGNGHKYQEPKPEPVTPKEPEPPKETKKAEPKEPPKTEPDKPDKQKDLILKLIKSHVFSDNEREKAISFCDNPDTTKEKAIKFIDSLQSHIKTRKELEKETLLKKAMEFRDDDPANFEIAMADFKKAYNTENAVTIEHFNHILAFQNGNGGNQQATA